MIKQTLITIILCCVIALNSTAQTNQTNYRTWKQTNHTSSNDKIALVIGNSQYLHTSSLREPANDAETIAAALTHQGYKVSINYNLDQSSFYETIDDFAKEFARAKEGIIYFAGHGFQVDGVNYLAPTDANPNNSMQVQRYCIDVKYLLRQIDQPKIPKVILFDACRNNPFASTWTDQGVRSGAKGMKKVRALTNSLVIFSTVEGNVVRDDNLFAESLAKHIKQGGCFSDILGRVDLDVHRDDPSQLIRPEGLLRGSICFGSTSIQNTKSAISNNSSLDSDGDGLTDQKDDCPMEFGPIINNGCPVLDKDGDGILDKEDNCPDEPGNSKFNGCPPPDVPARMVQIEGGTFTMGCTSEQGRDCDKDEKPTRVVFLNDFLIDEYEVTNAQYCDFLNEEGNQKETAFGVAWLFINNKDCQIEQLNNRFQPKSGYANHPVTCVSFFGASAYCKWRSKNEGGKFRLPTEAEWEYAARGGQLSNKTKFSGSTSLQLVGWSSDNSSGHSHQVGSKAPNELGLYDMSGNVREICLDSYDKDYYKKNENNNPMGPDERPIRVLRDGSFKSNTSSCRVSSRSVFSFDEAYSEVGFRCARTL